MMSNTTRKGRLSPWFHYQDGGSIAQLREHIDWLDGISIFGDNTPPPEFFAYCRDEGIGTLKLVGGTGAGAF